MDPGMVVPHSPRSVQSSSDGGRTFKYGHVPLKELARTDNESYEAVVKLFETVGDNLLGKFVRTDWSDAGWYIQDVITFRNNTERDLLHKYLLEQGSTFPRKMFGFSFDEDHVHILHSCAFSSNQCKCRWRKKDQIPCGTLKPGYRFKSRFREWGRRNFLAVIIYFFYKKGSYREAWLTGRRLRIESSRKYISALPS